MLSRTLSASLHSSGYVDILLSKSGERPPQITATVIQSQRCGFENVIPNNDITQRYCNSNSKYQILLLLKLKWKHELLLTNMEMKTTPCSCFCHPNKSSAGASNNSQTVFSPSSIFSHDSSVVFSTSCTRSNTN